METEYLLNPLNYRLTWGGGILGTLEDLEYNGDL